MEVKIFSISTQSANIVFISLSLRKSVALSNFSQYFVSVVSFSAMEILEIKSALLCACCASATLAPILVPERKSCFERTYSFFLSQRYLYSFTILTAKPKLLFSITFYIINYKIGAERPLIFHFPFSIFRYFLACEKHSFSDVKTGERTFTKFQKILFLSVFIF